MLGVPSTFGYIDFSLGDTGNCKVGGIVIRALAAGTLLIGDVVYFNGTALTVAKSTTNADYLAFAGIVVGGQTFSSIGELQSLSTEVGSTAATVGQWVVVQTSGIGWIKSDGAILAGSLVIPDASVAGECDVAGANPGVTLGTALEATADGSVGRMLIRPFYNEA